MSARGFLLRIQDDEDDSFDLPDRRPLSPNIIVSRADYFSPIQGGEDCV